MRLIKFEGYNITIEPELLLLKPFKTIWNRDRNGGKSKALLELGFIYFMEDPRSDYQFIVDKEERKKEIIKGEGLPPKWKPDIVVKEAIDYYASFKSTSALLLEDTRVAVEKLRLLLRDIDLNTKDDKGKPIYTLNVITSTIKQIPALVKDLDEAERSIAKELVQNDRVRGAQDKSIYEDI